MSREWPERFDYVAVGHVTVDVLADGAQRRPGGGAFYSGLQAARLGLRTLILTQGRPAEISALLAPYACPQLTVEALPAAQTTTLLTSGPLSGRGGGVRRQRVITWAGPIRPHPAAQPRTRILHLAPVAAETPARWSGAAEMVCLTPQGLTRRWPPGGGEIASAPLRDELLPAPLHAACISESERASCAPLLRMARETGAGGPVLAITGGDAPTTVIHGGEQIAVPAHAVAAPVDDLGAGDVFAAAFFVALAEGRSPAAAAAFGNAAAAVRIAGEGPQAIGDRHAIEAALADAQSGE